MPADNMPSMADEWRELNRDQRKERFLEWVAAGTRPASIARAVMVRQGFYQEWQRDREWDARYQAAKQMGREVRDRVKAESHVYDPDEHHDAEPPNITDFRTDYIGRPTPAHLQVVVDAWEDRTNKIVIALLPPGAGKDTTAGDIVLQETIDRTKKVAWVMESANFSARRLSRMEGYYWDKRAYVTPKGPDCQEPTKRMFDEFGAFKWDKQMRYPDGSKPAQPKWTQNELYFLGRENEADPNLWATGIGGAMYGSRIDVGILSDIFTEDNQNSPTQREQQISWIIGTFLSRLDDKGRALFLGTRVGEWDNWGRLIEELIGTAPVLHSDEFTTKYANGVCVIQIPAIQIDADGNDISYWPERFTLRDYLTDDDGATKAWVDELGEDEYMDLARAGYELVRGLYGIRGDSDASTRWFATAYQQAPPSGTDGEFPLALLDSCDDYERSYGMWTPGSTLGLGIDPARTGGAAWAVWEWDGEHLSVVDYFFGSNLGVTGMREKLLVDPISLYRPRYGVWESNRETSAIEHPDVQAAVKGAKTELRAVPTHAFNRGVGELRVAAMAFDMANGLIRWPAASQEDRRKSDVLKEHFLNWDQRERLRRVDNQIRQHIPDDIAMALWVGWVKMKQVIGVAQSAEKWPTRRVAASVNRSWGYRTTISEQTRTEVPTDLAALYYGDTVNG